MTPFDQFLQARKKDFARIAWHSQGEHTFDDVVNEAWLMGHVVAERTGVAIDFTDVSFQQTLLAHLFQHLVRYTELNLRHAVRLDHPAGGDADVADASPLLDRLVHGDVEDPLACLLADEARRAHVPTSNEDHSVASAYVLLLERFKSMYGVARRLRISSSYAYRCCRKARALAIHQHALALPPAPTVAVLGPWRRQRMERRPRQLEFDFREELPLRRRLIPAGTAA